ncbi:hypothetical protein LINPERHAP2_LOCUS37981, partial [Linum perenne]
LLKSPSIQTTSISPPVKLAIEEEGRKQKNPNEIASIEQSAVLRQEGTAVPAGSLASHTVNIQTGKWRGRGLCRKRCGLWRVKGSK